MAATLNDFFCGRISYRKSAICHAIEWGHAYVGTATESVYKFEGVPASLVPSSGSGQYTDAGGNSFTVSFVDSMTMSQTNPPHCASSNMVNITKRSIHLYDITVTAYTCTDGLS